MNVVSDCRRRWGDLQGNGTASVASNCTSEGRAKAHPRMNLGPLGHALQAPVHPRAVAEHAWAVYEDNLRASRAGIGQTLQGSFSAVSKQHFTNK